MVTAACDSLIGRIPRDGLDRLLTAHRGTLSGTHPNYTGIASRTFKQQWTLESLGNWKAFQHDADGDGAYTGAGDLDQTRTHNAVNELTGIDQQADPAQAAWVNPTYDAAGNMTSGPKPGPLAAGATRLFFQWDAWNRLVRVWQDSTTAGTLGTFEPGTHDPLVAEYRYDGRTYRIVKLVPHGGPAVSPTHWDRTDYYYNESWQVLEERYAEDQADANKDAPATAVRVQWLWDLRYIDAPVCRFRDTNANGTLDETLYYCNDANMNVTALVDAASGNVVERYIYDPYGKPTFLKADWTLQEVDGHDDGEASAYGNEVLYCGYRFNPETDQYDVRHRPYAPPIGRWLSRDPAAYSDSVNLYEYVGGMAQNAVDPEGLARAGGHPEWDYQQIPLARAKVRQLLAEQFEQHLAMGEAYVRRQPIMLRPPGELEGEIAAAKKELAKHKANLKWNLDHGAYFPQNWGPKVNDPSVPNIDARGYQDHKCFCQEYQRWSSEFHKDRVCFREIRPDAGPARSVCFHLDGATQPETSHDWAASASGKNDDGMCVHSLIGAILHVDYDVTAYRRWGEIESVINAPYPGGPQFGAWDDKWSIGEPSGPTNPEDLDLIKRGLRLLLREKDRLLQQQMQHGLRSPGV